MPTLEMYSNLSKTMVKQMAEHSQGPRSLTSMPFHKRSHDLYIGINLGSGKTKYSH